MDGVSASYRGDWLENRNELAATEKITYVGKDSDERNRGDIVKYDDGGSNKYWICRETHTISSSSTFDANYWNEFGATFTSVATELLITENSVVTNAIEIGQPGVLGRIHSNDFIGGGIINEGQFTAVQTGEYDYLLDNGFFEEYEIGGFNLGRDNFSNSFFQSIGQDYGIHAFVYIYSNDHYTNVV